MPNASELEYRSGLGLLLIDLQEPFIKSVQNPEALLERCKFTVEAANLLDIKVYLTSQVADKLGPVTKDIMDLIPETVVYDKTHFSCLGCSELKHTLDNGGIRHLLIAGLEIAVCIYQTTLDLLNEGYAVTLLSDAIDGRRKEDGAIILQYLQTRTETHILPSESAFYSILRHAGHPRMRDFTKLVKKYYS